MPHNVFYETCVSMFKGLGIVSGDVVMLHSDAIVLGPDVDKLERRKSLFFDALKAVVGKTGTILVPSFSMSWTKGETYDVENSPGNTGVLPDYVQTRRDYSRTQDPIFNFFVSGRLENEFLKLNPASCLGAGSVFDKFYQCDGKIICAGCALDRATFIHYVEEKRGVSYRGYKEFSGDTRTSSGRVVSGRVKFYVRDLNLDTSFEQRLLKERLISQGELVKKSLGRIACLSVKARDFCDAAIALLDQDEYALIKEESDGGSETRN